MSVEVTIYSRRGCHLCEVAEFVVRDVNKEVNFDLQVIYIDGDAHLESEYGEEVPVTVINGKRHDYFSIDRGRFISAVTSPKSKCD
jgi:glutaredoxin